MNFDLLECKRNAQELASSDNAPRNKNGKKKGYIEVMTDLWNAKGYEYLSIKSQNLRDQASRFEKNTSLSRDETSLLDCTDNSALNPVSTNIIDENSSSQNANLRIQDTNLHSSNLRFPEETQPNIVNGPSVIPVNLPHYEALEKPSSFKWGQSSDGRTLFVETSTINDAYNEITQWRKNAFLIPYGRAGKDFIDQLTIHFNTWNNGADGKHVSLKAAFVLMAVALQKPHKKSKAKEHQECLIKRLALWKDGDVDGLVREGRLIQRRLTSSKRTEPADKAKVFANLIMKGQIHSALRYLSSDEGGGILPLSDDVLQQLKEKHPDAQGAQLGSLLFGPIEDVPDTLFLEIDGEMVREAALRTKGSGGPCGIDADGFRRMLSSKAFKKSGKDLCDAIALMARRLCTEYVDPSSIEALISCRLIPLDKGEGAVRPIGVGEVLRRIIGKCVTKVIKSDIIEASGSLQVCAGLKSGNEAAIHAMRIIFEADDSDAVLLIDASNAFNALNRSASLHNIRVLCPLMATYAINTYRHPARLFVVGGQELKSSEGTTQGDPLAMSLYAISLQPLISHLQVSSATKQCWFADDAAGSGTLCELKKWWSVLLESGPPLGYFPNAKKCWLITKPEKEEAARDVFAETAINVTSEGHKHLGAVLGSTAFLEEYIGDKVDEWIGQVTKLAEFAITQPQACYAAFSFGLRHRWTYFIRTLPNITDFLEPLEEAISRLLIPAITDHHINDEDRKLLALPVRLGGLGFTNPVESAPQEHQASLIITKPLVQRIVDQIHNVPEETDIRTAKTQAMNRKRENLRENDGMVKSILSSTLLKVKNQASEKGASSWLSVIPLKDLGYDLNKGEFRDALKLRYNWEFTDIPNRCVCGDIFDINHAMTCRNGGFVIQRHNEIRDLEAALLGTVCKDVQTEPPLQQITGEVLNNGANTSRDARLDIMARGFWERQRSAYFDVRVFHPYADCYREKTSEQIFKQHENEKKRKYATRVLEIEQGSFTPLIFSTTGGMGPECMMYHKRLAELISTKKGETYSTTMTWIRSKVSFALLRCSLVCLRGTRVKRRTFETLNTDFTIDNFISNVA